MKGFIKDHKVAAIFVSIFIILAIIVGVASSSSTKSNSKKSTTTTTTQSSSSSTKSSGSSSTSSGSSSSTPSSSSSSSSGSSKSTGSSSSSSSSTGSSSTGSSSSSSKTTTDSENYDGTLTNEGSSVYIARTKELYDEMIDAIGANDTDAYYSMYLNGDFIVVSEGQKVKYQGKASIGMVKVKVATGDFKGYEGVVRSECYNAK